MALGSPLAHLSVNEGTRAKEGRLRPDAFHSSNLASEFLSLQLPLKKKSPGRNSSLKQDQQQEEWTQGAESQ